MDRLDPLDAALVEMEPRTQPQHVAAVLILSPPDGASPDYVDDLYRAALASTAPIDPRLSRYPHRGSDTGGMWIWRDAENLDIKEHVKRATLPPGAGREAFWLLISELHTQGLDRSRPMWTFHLIDGLDDGHFAFYVKVHHAVMDGVAGLHMITDALSPDPTRRSMPPIYGAQPAELIPPRATSGGRRIPNPFTMLRSLLSGATSSAALVEKVLTGEVSNLVASLTSDTTVGPLAAPFTRFNDELGDERTIAADTWSKDRIRAVQDKAAVTGNDIVVAVIAGVLRSWLLEVGELPEQSLVALCPITVRGHDHGADEHGNMFGAWLCPLGTDLEDPAERLDLIHRSMTEGKKQVASRGSGASLLLLVPTQALTVLLPKVRFAPKIRTGYNLVITNVPGPKTEMYWNGAHVEELYPVATIYHGLTLTVTVCSYADRVSFSYLTAPEVMPDIGAVIRLTERSLAELETAVG